MKKILMFIFLFSVLIIIAVPLWLHLTFQSEVKNFTCKYVESTNLEKTLKDRLQVHISKDPYVNTYLTKEELVYILNSTGIKDNANINICVQVNEAEQTITLLIYRSSVLWVESDIKLLDENSGNDIPLRVSDLRLKNIKLPESLTEEVNRVVIQAFKDYFKNDLNYVRELTSIKIVKEKIYLYSKAK